MFTLSSSPVIARQKMLLAATFLSFILLSFIAPSSAHMVMSEPPPIGYKTNPFYTDASADFDYTGPLSPSGSNYPCRGHLKDLDSPQGGSVATWAAGSSQTLKIAGSAFHGGGSCQGALSYDKGKSFTVIKSWLGNCPTGAEQTLTLQIPNNVPSGKVVFAWTWFNKIGNREMYMDCAVVTITGSGTGFTGPAPFLANIGNGCTTPAGKDVEFPNPGGTIERGANADPAAPVGNCQSQASTSTGQGTGDTSGGSSSVVGTSTLRETTLGTATKTATGQGETAVDSSFSYVYTATTESPSFTPLYLSSLNSPTTDVGIGLQSSKVPSDRTATSGYVYPGTKTNTVGGSTNVGQNLGCDYWRTQGYACSAAPPGLLGQLIVMRISFAFLVFACICGFLGVL